MKPMKFGVGQPVRRVEDERFISGRGCYTADVQVDGALAALFLRSPHATARFTIKDTSAATTMAGVHAVLTAADTAGIAGVPCLAPVPNGDGTPMASVTYPVLATDRVRYAGDAVALIIADTPEIAAAAAEAIAIDYASEPAVADPAAALMAGAPLVHAELGSNIAYTNAIGDKAATDAAFARAAHVVTLDIVNNRLVANFLEPRAAIGKYGADGTYTLTTSSQGVHGLRDAIGQMMSVPPEKIRVVTPDVGGGFGTKAIIYREYPLLLLAAKTCGRPVKWVADRTEHFLADAHGRANITHAEMALDAAGKFLALRIDIIGDLGAYLSQYGPYIHWLGATMATGPYDIGALHVAVRGVFTNTVPVDAYRGAGRPEAAYLLERLVDRCARDLGMARDDIRAKNFVRADQMPYKTLTDRSYDVGDFAGAMGQALATADWSGFDARAQESAARGALRGIGFASYIECTAWGEGEAGTLVLRPDGGFIVRIGTQSNGQGHATAYAQIVSEYLDVPLDAIRVEQGDTATIATGHGTGGSRSIPIGGVMVAQASEKMSERIKELAAEKLEAAVADVEIADGRVRIAGTDRSVTFAEIAGLPGAKGLATAGDYVPADATYPNGTHVCELEIDPDTGTTTILRYTVCDDFGRALNPLLLAGQVHGGIAQGIGQALTERTVFGSDGQLLTASLMDYCLPRADDLPAYGFETRHVPSKTNPLGLKGAGEAGSIGASPAVMNALIDALYRARGIDRLDMPATPARVFAALAAAGLTPS